MDPMLMVSNWISVQVRRLVRSEEGASLVEYALLVALIALVCVAAVTFLGETTSSKFSSTGDSLTNAGA